MSRKPLSQAQDASLAWRRENLRIAARELLRLSQQCPELFEHVLPIDDETRRTLNEILQAEDEEEPDHV